MSSRYAWSRRAASGERWSKTIRARTPEAQVARHAPGYRTGYGAGEYSRLSPADFAHPPPLKKLHTTGFLHFIRASLFVRGKHGEHGFAWQLSSDRERLYLGTAIFLAKSNDADNGSGFDEIEDVLCAPEGQPATYTWSLTRGPIIPLWGNGRYLFLAAVKDPCDKRRRLIEGVWAEIVPG